MPLLGWWYCAPFIFNPITEVLCNYWECERYEDVSLSKKEFPFVQLSHCGTITWVAPQQVRGTWSLPEPLRECQRCNGQSFSLTAQAHTSILGPFHRCIRSGTVSQWCKKCSFLPYSCNSKYRDMQGLLFYLGDICKRNCFLILWKPLLVNRNSNI